MRRHGLFLFLFFVCSTYGLSQASGRSSAFGEKIDLEFDPLVGGSVWVESGPWPHVSGIAPPAYELSDSQSFVTVSEGQLGQILDTANLEVLAASPLPGSNASSASSTVNNLDLDVAGLLQLLTLDAATVRR